MNSSRTENQAGDGRSAPGKRPAVSAWALLGFVLPAAALVSLVVWALTGDPLSVQTEIRRTALALEQLALEELAAAIRGEAAAALQRPVARGQGFTFRPDGEGGPVFLEPPPAVEKEIWPLPGDDSTNRSFRFLLRGFEERELVQNDRAGAADVLRLMEDRFREKAFQVRICLAGAAFLIRHDRFDEASAGLFSLIGETDPAAAPAVDGLPFVLSAFLLLDSGLSGAPAADEGFSASFDSVRTRLVKSMESGEIPLGAAELRAVAAECRSLSADQHDQVLRRADDLDLVDAFGMRTELAAEMARAERFALVAHEILWIGGSAGGEVRGAALPAREALPGLLRISDLGEAGRGFAVVLSMSGRSLAPGEAVGETIRSVPSPAGLAGTRLDLVLKDRGVFESSIRSRRIFLFVAAGLLVVAMAVLGFTTLRAVRREMAAAKAKSDFMAAVSHELRTPLASIQMFAELIDQGRVDGRSTEGRFMRLILSNCRRLSAMIENVLDLSRADRGVMRFRTEEVELKGLLDDLFRDIGAAAEEDGFTVDLAIAEDLPAVRADPLALSRALFNICDNALKYSEQEKRIAITAARDEGGVVISIRDSGPGIPEGEKEAIFDRFRRGRVGAESRGGAGLGLSLAREAVEACDGRIRVESREGEGTVFNIFLPALESDHE